MISETLLAKKYGVSRRSVYRWRQNGYIQPIYQDGSRILYEETDTDKRIKSYPQLIVNKREMAE